MAKFLRQYDPSESKRRVTIEISEDVCPGMLEALSILPYGHETPLIRAVMYQWILDRQTEGDLDEAMLAALAGPGGRPDGRRPNKMAMGSAKPARGPVAKVAKPTRIPVQRVQSVRRSEVVQVQEPVLVSSSPTPVLSTVSAQPALSANLEVTSASATSMAPSTSGPPVATPDHSTPVDVSALTAGELEGISELDTMFN